ncbi:hypothetical protein AAVH_22817 [Aphelenchoides avenae]|nr:hypothetical protein AAVH_22817 [Aphelenchus avenae]
MGGLVCRQGATLTLSDLHLLPPPLESFLRTNDAMGQIRFDVLDRTGVAVKRLKGFHREADKFVKEVRHGTKTFSASVQALSQNIVGRRFY